MISFIFPTTLGVEEYRSKRSIPIMKVEYANSNYSVLSKGLRAKYYTFSTLYEQPVLDNNHLRNVGNCPLVKWWAGLGLPIQIPSSEISDTQQFAIFYDGYFQAKFTATIRFTLYGIGCCKIKFNNVNRIFNSGLTIATLSEIPGLALASCLASGAVLTAGNWYPIEITYWSKAREQNSGLVILWDSVSSLNKKFPISAGVSSYGGDSQPSNGSNPIASTILQHVIKTELNQREGSSSKFTFDIPLVRSTASIGYKYIQNGDYLRQAVGFGSIKKFKYVRYSEGFKIGSTSYFTKKFEGQIRDWSFDRKDKDIVLITCYDWGIFAKDSLIQDNPNPSDYWSVNYYTDVSGGVAGGAKPRTYDAWKIEDSITNLLMNSYIDPIKFIGRKKFINASSTLVNSNYLVENYSLATKLAVELEKPLFYGNIGLGLGDVPPDDPYNWQFGIGEYNYDAINKIVDNFGYSWGFNNEGNLFLRRTDNPIQLFDPSNFTYTGSWLTATHLNSFGGYYKTTTSNAVTATKFFFGQKVALIVSLLTNGATISVKVNNPTLGNVSNASYNLKSSYGANRFYYEGIDPALGKNPCMLVLASRMKYDRYKVTITTSDSGGAKTKDLNALFVYDSDKMSSNLIMRTGDVTATRLGEITNLGVEETTQDVRNDCIVVGKLLGKFTSLAETGEQLSINPNNPQFEHIISRTVDIDSISNPTVSNFVGRPLQTVIVEPKVSTQDKADWLSYEFIQRFRKADDSKSVRYQILGNPLVEVGDCVSIKDVGKDTLATSQNFWIVDITNQKDRISYTTDLTVSPYKPWKSFEVKPIPSITQYGSVFNNVVLSNRGVLTTLHIAINATATWIYVKNTSGISPIGWCKIDSETIYYGNYNATVLRNCQRGKQTSSVASHSVGASVNLAIDPYLSEERGINPEIRFNLVLPGDVRIKVLEQEAPYLLDILTGISESKDDKRWETLDWGKNLVYRWGMLDAKGEFNKTTGTYQVIENPVRRNKDNNNLELLLEQIEGADWYIGEALFNNVRENSNKAIFELQYKSKKYNRFEFFPMSSPISNNYIINTRRGRQAIASLSFPSGAGTIASPLDSFGKPLDGYGFWVFTGTANNGSGTKVNWGSTNSETRLCQVKIVNKMHRWGLMKVVYSNQYGAESEELKILQAGNQILIPDELESEILVNENNVYDVSKIRPAYLSVPDFPFYPSEYKQRVFEHIKYYEEWNKKQKGHEYPKIYIRYKVYVGVLTEANLNLRDNSGRSSGASQWLWWLPSSNQAGGSGNWYAIAGPFKYVSYAGHHVNVLGRLVEEKLLG